MFYLERFPANLLLYFKWKNHTTIKFTPVHPISGKFINF